MAGSYPNYYQQMTPQYPYNRPNYMEQATPQFPNLKGRPVSSIDEARASMIDFDGSIFYFPDQGNKRIYTKQINIDGTSSLREYVLNETTPEISVNYSVTKEEFENLQQDVGRLKEMITAMTTKASKQTDSQSTNYKF